MKYSVLKTKSWQQVLASLLFAAIGLGVGQSRASAIDLGGLRTGHTATLLTSGQVLITGGNNETDFLSSAELYDLVTRNVTAVGAMTTARANHTVTFVGMKAGFLEAAARKYVGEIHFVDIGAPRRLVDEYLTL